MKCRRRNGDFYDTRPVARAAGRATIDPGAKPLLEAIAGVFVCRAESARTNCCYYRKKLFESYSQLTKSALAENDSVKFENLVS